MPIRETATYRILANVLQRTFGRSSEAKYPTHFLSLTLPVENLVQAKFVMIVNFGHENVFFELKRRYHEEALELIEKAIGKVAEEYKTTVADKDKLLEPKVEPYEQPPKKTITLKLQENSIQESIEYVSTSLYTPKKTAYYRVTALIEVK